MFEQRGNLTCLSVVGIMLCFLCPRKAEFVSYFWNILALYVICNTDPAPCPRATGKYADVDLTSLDGDDRRRYETKIPRKALITKVPPAPLSQQEGKAVLLCYSFKLVLWWMSYLFSGWNKGEFLITRRKGPKTHAVYVYLSMALLTRAYTDVQRRHTFSLYFAYIIYTMQCQSS